MTVAYTNPLSIPLTSVVLSIASPGGNYTRLEQQDIPANGRFTATTTTEVLCGDNETSVMIPVSLDTSETQSTYGLGWTSCSDDTPNGGITLSMITWLQVMLITMFALFMFN